MILPLAALFNLATAGVSAQSTADHVLTLTYPAFPTGVSSGTTWLTGVKPLVCDVGCLIGAELYPSCFINQTLADGSRQNQTLCDAQFCNPTTFNTFSQCLNCIIANGGERPFGYPVGEPLDVSTVPPPPYDPEYPHVPKWIDTTVANEMLKNVSDRCSSINRALTTGLTVTATATTTGPYNTTWMSGETISMPEWTGLSGYAIPTVTGTFTLSESTGSASPTSPNSASAGPTSGTPASASAPSSTTARSSANPAASIAPFPVVAMLFAVALGQVLIGN